jgi:hypothetical protein
MSQPRFRLAYAARRTSQDRGFRLGEMVAMAGPLAYVLASRFGTGLAVAALAAAAWPPAAAAASSGWQLTLEVHTGAPASDNGMTSVAAVAGNDAWAVGGTYPSGYSAGVPVAEHWNGIKWQAATLPGGLTGTLGAVSTPAATDVWTVSQLTGYALHWNGTTWSVAKKWPESHPAHELTGVTAFSPADVWVFGAPSANYPGLGTWHLSGTTWTRVTGLAGSILTASALSPTSMWAIGSDGTAPDDILLHYNGASWQRITSAVLNGLRFSRICVKHANDIYALGRTGNGAQHLVHFNGFGWKSLSVPSSVQLRDIAPDGSNGEWFTATQSSTHAPVAEHRAFSGTWTSNPLPGGSGGQAFGIAMIPGTTSLWATGFVPLSGGTGADAVIWGHGPGT